MCHILCAYLSFFLALIDRPVSPPHHLTCFSSSLAFLASAEILPKDRTKILAWLQYFLQVKIFTWAKNHKVLKWWQVLKCLQIPKYGRFQNRDRSHRYHKTLMCRVSLSWVGVSWPRHRKQDKKYNLEQTKCFGLVPSASDSFWLNCFWYSINTIS